MKQVLPLFLFFGVISFGTTQNIPNRCYCHRSEPPATFEKWIRLAQLKNRVDPEDSIYVLPVVVHVIHLGDPIGTKENISLEQIESQIRILNEDFRRKPGTNGFNTHPAGGDARIEFQLAKRTPDGLPTDGIVRVDITQIETPPFGGSMIGLGAYFSFWDPNQYINIWSFPGVQDFGLGEAKFPITDLPGLEGEGPAIIPGLDSIHGIPVDQVDGVAINAYHFGERDIDSPYRFGRTGTHEMGHFLGLFHVWGDDGFEGSCEIDDYCEDTPNVASRTSGCPSQKLACDGHPAMIENYMDYTDDVCMNMFTMDQIARMRYVLQNSPRRKSLLSSAALLPPDVVSTHPPIDKQIPPINFYPNPIKDQLIILWKQGQKVEQGTLKVYDAAGKIWLTKPIELNGGEFQVDLSRLPAGIYFVTLQWGEYLIQRKIVKQP